MSELPVPTLLSIASWPPALSLLDWGGWRPRRHAVVPPTLPVEGLPAGLGQLAPGQPAVLLLGDEGLRRQALRGLLSETLAHGSLVWVGASEEDLTQLDTPLCDALRHGRLRAVAWAPQAAVHLPRRHGRTLLRELADYGLHRHELLMLEPLAPWLAHGTPPEQALQAALALLRDLARVHRAPVLALVPAQVSGLALGLLLASDTGWPCLAEVHAQGAQAYLDVRRWTGGPGKSGWRDFTCGLVARPSGGWAADAGPRAADTQRLLTAPDAQTVLTTEAVAQAAGALPPHWKALPDLSALLAASRRAVAATVLLPYETPAALPALAGAVYSLRMAHPHVLKIVVRELGSRLRYHQELALLRLGANAVAYQALSFARAMQLLHRLRNELHAGVPAVDVQAMQAAIAPEPLSGYLPAPRFVSAVRCMLERSQDTVPLAHSMVRLPLLPHVAHLEALVACRLSRKGDLVTTQGEALLLFLFACNAVDVASTLAGLFANPVEALFCAMTVWPDADTQRARLDALARDSAPATDYTAMLASLQTARPSAASGATTAVSLPLSGPADTPTHLDPGAAALPPRQWTPCTLTLLAGTAEPKP